MRPTWRVRHIDPVLCPRFLVSSFGGDVDIDAKAIVVEGELVDDQGVLVQNVHLATNAVVRLDQVSNKLNLIGRGWPLVQQPAVWESPRGRNAKHQKKICRRKKNPTSTLFPACWGCGRASDRGRSKVTWAVFAFSSFKFWSKHIYYCGFTTVLKSILDLQRHCKAFHFHSQLSLDLPTSLSCIYMSKLCCKWLASPVWRVVTKPAWRWLLWVGGSRYISSTTTMPPAFSSNHLCTLAKFWGKTVIYDSASFLQNILDQMFISCIFELFNNELIALACWSAVHFASISHIQCCWVSLSMENSTFKNETVFS